MKRVQMKKSLLLGGLLVVFIGIASITSTNAQSDDKTKTENESTIEYQSAELTAPKEDLSLLATAQEITDDFEKIAAAGQTQAANYSATKNYQEYDQDADAYYAARGATRATESETISVNSWSEFRNAYQNESIEKIKLTADIYQSGLLTWTYERRNNLEIDGHYLNDQGEDDRYILSLYDVMLRTSASNTGFTENVNGSTVNRSIFYLHDVSIAQNGNRVEIGGTYGFVGATPVHADIITSTPTKSNTTRNWYFRFGNVDTETDNNSTAYNGMARLLIGYGAEVTLFGKMQLSGTAENFYLGSLILEDGTDYRGTTEYSNYSVVWFVTQPGANDTGASREMTVGDNANMYLNNVQSAAQHYPAIFAWYKDAVIGENSTFSSNMPGNAWRFDFDGSLTVKNGASVNLLSRANGSVVQYGSRLGAILASNRNITATIDVEAGGSFFVFGSATGTGLANSSVYFGASSTSNNARNSYFRLDSPKAFDIRNTSNSRAFDLRGFNNYFELVNSDLDLWHSGASLTGAASEGFTKLDNLKIMATGTSTGRNQNLQVSSSEAAFPSTSKSIDTYSRLSAMNSNPQTIWSSYYTDADKAFQAQVKLGDTPISYDQTTGEVVTQPVWASSTSQIKTVIKDTLGNQYSLVPDDSGYGYLKFTADSFQKAGENITAISTRGTTEGKMWREEPAAVSTILDVTPPSPIKLTSNRITEVDKQLAASGLEPHAKVYLQVNEGTIESIGTVSADGNWQYTLPQRLAKGSSVRLYLEDASTLPADFNQTGLTATRQPTGNRNPKAATTYQEATFPAATVYTVEEAVVDEISISKSIVDENGGNEVIPGDVLTYKIELSNDEAESSNIIWSDVKVSDVLDSGLDFDLASGDLQVNGKALDSDKYHYEAATRTLSVSLGDILPTSGTGANKQVISFKARVNDSAVGSRIKNAAVAVGQDAGGNQVSRTSNEVLTETVRNNTVTVHFLTVDDLIVHPPVVVSGTAGSQVNLAVDKQVTQALDRANQNYQLVSRPTPEVITISGNGDTAAYVFDGVLSIQEFPETIDFGTLIYDSTIQRVDKPNLGEKSLSILDTRANTQGGWTLTATLTKKMINQENHSIMENALRYVTAEGKEATLSADGTAVVINPTGGSANISNGWGDDATTEGLKLVADPSQTSGSNIGAYSAEITWVITAGPTGTP
ncbi:pectate lyase-like adhesive domain-containing protein [Enterococcus sp. LJL120]